jgi:hypothetical protein
MSMRLVSYGAFVAILTACARPGVPPPSTVHTVAVLTPVNRTGDELLVTGGSVLERYAFHTYRVTVSDVLAIELRSELARRGFAVVPPEEVESATQGKRAPTPDAAVALARAGDLHDPLLLVAIDQWQTNGGTEPDFIIVALDATLVDPATGDVLWHVRRSATPVATPGTVTLGSAYEVAATKVAADLLAPWGTAR